MFKFVHSADIHLDSPLLGLERYDGAPVEEIRGATRRALENLVQLAIEEAVQFVLIAGDLYDGDWRDAGTGLYFVKQMARLREAHIPVFLISGNHDAANKMTRELRFPENVRQFSARKPETARIPEIQVAIHGQSYATADVRNNLAEDYPKPDRDAFNIGLLHTCGAGAPGHAPYAPCTLAELSAKGYQYWALGHVHTAQALCEDPPIVFPGNIQGRHIREAGPRGCLLVSVDERHQITREFVPLDVLRWHQLELDATGAADADAVITRFVKQLPEVMSLHPGQTLAIRVRVSGATAAHRRLNAERKAMREQLQSAGVDLGHGAVWIEKLVIDTQPEGPAPVLDGSIGELKQYLADLRGNSLDLEALLRDILPPDVLESGEPVVPLRLLDEVEALLMERLLGTEAAQWKILNLDLIAYGPFTERSLDFQTGTANLHILYGPNEAGKSCTLHALSDVLFGIPHDTQYAFLHPYDALRIGLTLDSPQGALTVVRRKGRASSLRRNDGSDTVFPPAEWLALLPVRERNLFDMMFGVDHAEIARGGELLLDSKGDLGAMLFAASGGVERLHAVRAELQTSADELYKKGASKPVLNKALSALKDAQAAFKHATMLVSEYKHLRDSVEEAEDQSRKLEKEISAASLEQQRLQRMLQAFPLAAKRRQRIAQLREHQDIRALAQDFEDRYRSAHDALREAETGTASQTRDIESLKGTIDATPVALAILEKGTEIELLYQEGSSVKKGAADAVKLQQKLEDARAAGISLLQSIGVRMTLEQATTLRVPEPAQKRIFTLATSQKAEAQKVAASAQSLEKAREEQRRTIAELAGLPTALDTFALDEALALQPPGRDLESEHSTLAKVAVATGIELQRAVSALPDWHGTLEELASAAAPLPETVAEFQADFLQHAAEVKGLLANRSKLATEQSHVDRDLRRIEQEQEVPTEHDLDTSRISRDSQWQTIRGAWLETLTVDGPALASSFETSVSASDQIADRLRREATRVSEKAALLVRREQLAEQAAALQSEIQAELRAAAALQTDWESCWSTTAVSPRTPKEMQSWLLKRESILKQMGELQQRQAELVTLEETILAIRRKLIPNLEAIGGDAIDPDTPLSALAARARVAVARQVELRQKRAALQAEEQKSIRTISDLEERLRAANSALSDWQRDWSQATADLPVRPGASPDEVQSVLDVIKSLMAKIDEIEKLSDRVTKLAKDEAAFTANVSEIVKAAGLPLPAGSSFLAIQTLHTQLQNNRSNRDLLQTLSDQVAKKQNDLRRSQDQIARCHALLADLCIEAGAPDPASLPVFIERAAEKRAITSALTELEDSLLSFAGGATLEKLAVELESLNPDELPDRIDALQEHTTSLREQKAGCDQSLGASRQELLQKVAAASAIQAAEDVQHLRSRIANLTEEYVRLRLASRILTNAVERFRDRNQGPLLQTAAGLFRQLTGNSFKDLRVDWNEQGAAGLIGIRGSNQNQVAVDVMSEATRDQLFLALRLAFVSNYCDSHGPVPFIADDVLMTFDDARAAAALTALHALSQHTQVLLFTHHQHHLELARQALAPGAYRVHHLG